jgi:DNA phosphorothioation-associated DGQHR protein 1
MIEFPYRAKALRVEQPLGIYYATVLPAELLLDVCFSDRLKAHKVEGGTYVLEGTQRLLDEKRLKTIGAFISRNDSAFPNSIILAANSRAADGFIEEASDTRWRVEWNEPCGDYTITIPTKQKLSSVIDGQHRLFSFAYAPDRLSMTLVCSVFFDLPKPFQAQLFATINSTQKPVDKSQTYELFGYNISEESESFWSPDKLAVFFARRLNTEDDSPIKGRVAIAPESDASLQRTAIDGGWQVSMATVVEGIIRLISSNPKQDSNELLDLEPKRREILSGSKRIDRSPLRGLYLEENDKLIYLIISNFLAVCNELFWKSAPEGSFIIKTVGVQALFDVLRLLSPRVIERKDASVSFFRKLLSAASEIDFATEAFRNASGSGRTAIRRAIEERLPADTG